MSATRLVESWHAAVLANNDYVRYEVYVEDDGSISFGWEIFDYCGDCGTINVTAEQIQVLARLSATRGHGDERGQGTTEADPAP